MWTGTKFIAIQDVAKGWKLDGPYLYPVPSNLAFRKRLTASLGIKDKFTPEDIVRVLFQMKEDFNNHPVSDACQKLLRELVSQLYNIEPSECSQPIWLPDTSFVMHISSDLAFNDAPWCKPEEHYKFVNDIIPRKLALKLKVKPVRSKKLEKYASQAKLHFRGAPFGQHEELTRRIQNILRDYPFDITVLKELLQNADDAKATKMYVILDKRTHGQESVLSEDWQQLQGPALLVWNDSTFSEKDLEGIQQLGLGSKRSDAESIGQYGIGFNVVYHLTDCPSFITGGETLCIMDPHCRFVPEASTEMPGRRFDDLRSGFWEDFPDLKSAYLQDGLKDCPPELLGGSLFRFPLRHTYNLMQSSKIVDHSTSYRDEPLTADKMHRYLTDWAPKMKQALLFLNHVTELCFFTIEDHKQVMLSSSGVSYTSIPSLVSEHCFQVRIDESGKQSRAQLHEKFTAFKEERGSEPCVVRYPLTITETLPDTLMKMEKQKTEEKWLIQEGIGDLEDKQQTWNYISLVKPKHGIAAPLSSSTEHIRAFFGNVFCFLPLPVSCNLPVHVNAHFILNASRRNLWQSTVPGEVDDKSRWNENLLKAISSSYADFLVHARSYYIKSEPYNDLSTLQNDLRCYYSVFPNWSKREFHSRCVPEGPWLKLAEDIYRKLASHNANVLATIESTQSIHSTTASFQVPSGPNVQHTMKWHPMKNLESPSSQVYFWAPRADHNDAPVKPILERIGMKITCAPLRIKNHFHTVECDIPETSPSSVYDYYTQFSGQVSPSGRFPCAVEATTFHSVTEFKLFTMYLLQPSESEPGNREFSKTPFDNLLLLTADAQLRNFDESNKVISSQYSQLFPESFEMFLHPELLDQKYTTNYFLSPAAEDDPQSCTIPEILQGILSKALPHALQTTHVHNACEYITKSELNKLWACLSSDKTFFSYLRNILWAWALLPSTTNQLFSSRNMLLPVIPPTSFLIPHGKAEFSEIYKLLQHLGMPFLATDVVDADVVQSYCPQLSDYERILTNLYHLHRETDISSMITKDNVATLITYLRNTNFCKDECQKYVKALPLFLTIEGNLTALNEKAVYIWPTNAYRIGYSTWVNGRNVEFLDSHGDWTRLGHESDLEIQEISAEQLYINYIFPMVYKFCEDERFKHLKHIRDCLFGRNILNLKSGSPSQKQQAQRFFNELRNLRCFGRDGELLKQASEVCTHEKIFTIFAEHFCFLSKCFTSDEDEYNKWLEFFRVIGLRESITKQEYQQFCTETAGGRHPDPRQASLVLLNYLFSEQAENDEWNTDINFLSSVSHIPFVCTERLPKLSWIEPVCPSENHILPIGIDMTKLAGAALDEHSSLLWTVKPIVHLPCNRLVECHENILAGLQVTTSPSVADVTANLLTLAKSRFANFELFDRCPQDCRPPENATGLLKVLLRHFEFLDSTSADLQLLSSLSCIPVYATPDQSVVAPNVPVVLVKPNHVLTDRDAREYYPFLHYIPNELASVLPLLQQIGVKSSFELEHMRVALENAYKCSDQLQLEFNTADKVVKVIERLYTMLEQIMRAGKVGDEDIVSALKPLYLPSTEGKLVCTSDLVYCDSIMYKRCELDHLAEANLFLLHLPNTHYKFNDSMFCEYLPEAIRPKGLSTCCEQTLREECTIVDVSEPCFADDLKATFALPEFPEAVLEGLKHFTGDDEVCKNFEQFLQNFLKIRVFAIKNDLQTDIILTTVQPKQTLGRATVDFYLQRDEHSFDFYAKLGMSDVRKFYMFEYLGEYLISAVKSVCANISFPTHSELKRFLTMLLMTHTAEDIHDVLDEQKLFLDSAVTPKLGMLIPESWHQCLDQDISNVFDRKEQVGYKDEEGNLIFAQVIHPVVAEDGGSCSSEDPTCMRYKICASENDEEGIEVSALDLCKIPQEKRAMTGKILALTEEESKPNPEEGKRWVKQAEVEFRALKVLLKEVSSQPDLSCTVCFMAHQVAEKALKGGIHGKCGSFYFTRHELSPLVDELQKHLTDQDLINKCVTTLDSYYLDTRYPDRHPRGIIPADHYSPEEAQQAKEKAETILDMMKTLINS